MTSNRLSCSTADCRENKNKKAISDAFFKCFALHSCICFHAVCQPLGRSCLEHNALSTWKMLANAMRNWPEQDRQPISLSSIISHHHPSELCVPCLGYTTVHLHTHAQCLECPPLLCPPENSFFRLSLSHFLWVITVRKRSYLSATQITCRIKKCSLVSLENN